MTILILGGTSKADQLADYLKSRAIEFVYSLASESSSAKARVYQTRIGRFGGVIGLARYINQNAIRMVIDATHPFAQKISEIAITAAIQDGIPLLRLESDPWTAPNGVTWHHVKTVKNAAETLPKAATVFLSIDSQSAAEFAHRNDIEFISRANAQPQKPFGKVIIADPPFSIDAETALFRQLGVTHLVTKNTGGDDAKLIAAQRLGITVVMIDRPPLPVAETATDFATTMSWIERRL